MPALRRFFCTDGKKLARLAEYGIVNEKMKELRQYALKNNKIILDKPNDYNLRQIGENIG